MRLKNILNCNSIKMNKEVYVIIRQLEEDNDIYVYCYSSLWKARASLESIKKAHLDYYRKNEDSTDFDYDINGFKDYSEWVYCRIEKKYIL